jgi:hypothetical protein
MAGLVPVIHVFDFYYDFKTGMPGTRPGMSYVGLLGGFSKQNRGRLIRRREPAVAGRATLPP